VTQKNSNYQNARESQFSVGAGVSYRFEADAFDRRKTRNDFKFSERMKTIGIFSFSPRQVFYVLHPHWNLNSPCPNLFSLDFGLIRGASDLLFLQF
jgi:hypothetical protein